MPLASHGTAAPQDPSDGADVALYLQALAVLPDWRPEGWRERCAAWRAHPVPLIRSLAAIVADRSGSG